jgi:hypothetical protein
MECSRIFAQSEISLDAVGIADAHLNVIERLYCRSGIEGLTLDEYAARRIELGPLFVHPKLVQRLDHGTVQMTQQQI